MEKKWFLLHEGQVQGPYSREDIETHLKTHSQAQVWGRGLPEWMPPHEWRTALQDLGKHMAPVAEEPTWKFRIGADEKGPFTFLGLLDHLRKVEDYTEVELASESFSGWKEIYSVQSVVEELGITRRAHPRVPIMGTLKIESPSGPVEARVVSISEGGVGINGDMTFKIGEKFKGVLQSPNLFVTINCTCEVVYIGEGGYTGIRFQNIPHEAKAAVVEYVNKFK